MGDAAEEGGDDVDVGAAEVAGTVGSEFGVAVPAVEGNVDQAAEEGSHNLGTFVEVEEQPLHGVDEHMPLLDVTEFVAQEEPLFKV